MVNILNRPREETIGCSGWNNRYFAIKKSVVKLNLSFATLLLVKIRTDLNFRLLGVVLYSLIVDNLNDALLPHDSGRDDCDGKHEQDEESDCSEE